MIKFSGETLLIDLFKLTAALNGLWLDEQAQVISPRTEIVNHWGLILKRGQVPVFHHCHCI